MNCSNPYVTAGLAFGCGQCMPCRYNRRRIWATRILVEAAQYKNNAFVTCTYAEESKRYSLVPSDMQQFIKKLRARYDYATGGSKFRFFGVGEYGEQSEGAHFHFMLFNFPTCVYRRSRYGKRVEDCCFWCDMVRDAWGQGHVYLGEVENDSAGYVAQYVTKKLNASNPALGNRYPEFARMSLKPGIGANAMFDVASTLLNYQNTLDTLSDVPGELMIGRRKVPIGRYLRKKLRTYVGRDEKTPQSEIDKIQKEMQALRLAAREDDINPSFKARLIAMGAGKRASMEAKQKLRMSAVKHRRRSI